jgi:ferritin
MYEFMCKQGAEALKELVIKDVESLSSSLNNVLSFANEHERNVATKINDIYNQNRTTLLQGNLTKINLVIEAGLPLLTLAL